MKLAYLQSEPLLNVASKNIERLTDQFKKLRNADLVVVPELANSGYNFKNKTEAAQSAEEINNGPFCEFLSS